MAETQFVGVDVIDTYTLRDAVEDGVIVDLSSVGKIPVYAPIYGHIRYATRSLLSRGYLEEDQPNLCNLADLLVQASKGIRTGLSKGENWLFECRVEFPNGTRGTIWAAVNDEGSLTLMLPGDY